MVEKQATVRAWVGLMGVTTVTPCTTIKGSWPRGDEPVIDSLAPALERILGPEVHVELRRTRRPG